MPSKVSRSINLIETGWQATPTGARKTRRTSGPGVDFLCNAMGVCAATSLWSLGIGVRGRVFFVNGSSPATCVALEIPTGTATNATHAAGYSHNIL